MRAGLWLRVQTKRGGWTPGKEREQLKKKVDSNSHFNFVVLTAEQSAQCRWISVKQACGLYFDVFR